MNISQNGIDLIKHFEGFREEAYQDGGGVWTVGYGTTRLNGRPVQRGDRLDEPQALKIMVTKANSDLSEVSARVKVNLNQNQVDAIASFIYNLGTSAFEGSTLLHLLNEGNIQGAADQFPRWCHDNGKVVAGLVTRRAAEKELFLKA